MNQVPTCHYQIKPYDPYGHTFEVTIEIHSPQQPFQTLSLPNWIPGSYLIRDFSKHIINLNVFDENDVRLDLEIIDKSSWRFASTSPVKVCYEVYAWDLSVRGAHFDQTHAFFNGTSVFLAVDGQRDLPCAMTLLHSEFSKSQNWYAASTLPKANTDTNGFGDYTAANYHELIDHPFEIGNFQTIEFEACGIPHKMIFTGKTGAIDFERLQKDLTKICEYELNFFGKPYPINEYLFQVTVTGSDYGGLEHRSSTALICSRYDLPYPGMSEASDGYLQFLELCSHEYFHTWNVKRIMPAIYQNHPLDQPAFTEQLWWFEGVTSYYDALILLRSNVIDESTYLKLLGQQMTRVYRMPGRFKQTLAESSTLTWTKFYQQDENAPNAIISYYTKGSLMAIALDLILRYESKQTCSLDHIIQYLWNHFGAKGIGLEEGQIQSICHQLSGLDLSDFFEQALYSHNDFDFARLMKPFGYSFDLRAAQSIADLGGTSAEKTLNVHIGANLVVTTTGLEIKHIWRNGSLATSGLASGDVIIALDHIKVSSIADIERVVARNKTSKAPTICHFFRRDELMKVVIKWQPNVKDRVVIGKQEQPTSKLNKELTWLA